MLVRFSGRGGDDNDLVMLVAGVPVVLPALELVLVSLLGVIVVVVSLSIIMVYGSSCLQVQSRAY